MTGPQHIANPEKRCYLNWLGFEQKHQGARIGRDHIIHQVRALKKQGFAALDLNANVGLGTYAWARMGLFEYAFERRPATTNARFRAWAARQGIAEPAAGWPNFVGPCDVANYTLPGYTLRASQINTVPWPGQAPIIPDSAVLEVGKAFMLDKSEDGHGSWDARLNL